MLALNSDLLELLNAIDVPRSAWQDMVNRLHQASDEVWLAQMDEVERLEIQYRAHQDQLCLYLTQAVAGQCL